MTPFRQSHGVLKLSLQRALSALNAPTMSAQERVLQVGLVGYPNAGKSELTNKLVGQRITAVSEKRNTTISAHLGVFTAASTQILLYDTPGIVQREDLKYTGQANRVRGAWATAEECDVLLLMVDACRQFVFKPHTVFDLAATLSDGPSRGQTHERGWSCPPTILILNKVDKLDKAIRKIALDGLTARFQSLHPFECTFCISALTGEGVPQLREHLINKAVPGPWLLSKDQVTDKTNGELALDKVREKLFRTFSSSVPYQLVPHLVSCDSQPDGSIRVRQVIRVPTPHMKGIILGAGGSLMSSCIIEPAQRELAKQLGCHVLIDIDVQVAKKRR